MGAGFIHLARPHRLLEDACRLAEIADVGLVVVEGPVDLVAPRYGLIRTAIFESGKRDIRALGALLVVEDAGAFPEDLLEGRRPCLHAPAGVGALDVMDERFIRRCSRTRMERKASTLHGVSVVRPTVVVMLPIAPRAVRIPSGVVRAIVVGRARFATVQPTGAQAV